MSRGVVKVLVAVVAVMAVGAVVPAEAGAAKLVVNGAGSVHCTLVKGKMKFSPGLQSTPHPTTTTVKMKLSCDEGETGVTGITVIAAKVIGTSFSPSLSCAALAVPFPEATEAPFTLDVKWKAKHASVHPTTIHAPNWAFRSVDYIVLAGTNEGPPCVTVTGSYAGQVATSGVTTTTDVNAGCAKKKGLKKIVLQPVLGSMTLFAS
jgi:hypothetical protein